MLSRNKKEPVIQGISWGTGSICAKLYSKLESLAAHELRGAKIKNVELICLNFRNAAGLRSSGSLNSHLGQVRKYTLTSTLLLPLAYIFAWLRFRRTSERRTIQHGSGVFSSFLHRKCLCLPIETESEIQNRVA